jgi:MFS family permease
MNQVADSQLGPFHPSRRPYRFTILLIASFMLFGSYFAYDSVGAIETTLMRVLGVDRGAIGAMYTMYSVAAIFSVLIGGMLIDRIGTRRASILFSALVTVGAALVAWAPNLWVLYAGRLIFGMGSESLVVAQNAILARWFSGKELALAFGIALAVSRLGTLFSFNTEALIDQRFGYQAALWAAAALCMLSLGANLIYNLMDRRSEGVLALREAGAGEKIRLADIRRFRPSYWYVTFLCLTFYSAVFPFTALSTDFFHDKWGLPNATAEGHGFFQGVFYNITHIFNTAQGTTTIIITASMFFAPFAGGLVDRIGRRASLMILGSLLMIPAHLLMGLTHLSPIPLMIVLGAAFVLVPAAMWPSIPLIVDKERVGTAYGLMTMIQNFGLAAFPYFNGQLRDATHGYTASQIMFASLGAVGLVFAVLLWRADRQEGGALERGHPNS